MQKSKINQLQEIHKLITTNSCVYVRWFEYVYLLCIVKNIRIANIIGNKKKLHSFT